METLSSVSKTADLEAMMMVVFMVAYYGSDKGNLGAPGRLEVVVEG